VNRILPAPAHIGNRCKSNPCSPVAVRNDGDKRWPSWSNSGGKEPNHRSLGGGTFQRSGVHQGVCSPEVLVRQDDGSCARYKRVTLAHTHERDWCCRLMKENLTDPGDSYAVSRTGRMRQGRVIRQRKTRSTQRCGRSDPSLFHFKESAFIKGVAETNARCWESTRSG
jgi:hypothetical protein